MNRLRWSSLQPSRLLALSLTAITASLAGQAVIAARWTPGVTHLGPVVALALACGLGLGLTRWRAPLAAAYSLLLSLAVGLELTFDLYPWWAGLSGQALDVLRVRLWTMGEVFRGWSTLTASGEAVTDTRLFDLVVGLLLWQMLAALGWAVVRRRNLWPAVGVLGGTLALNQALAGLDDRLLVGVVATLLALIAVVSWEERRRAWDEAGVDSPYDLWDHALPPAALIITLAAGVALALPWVGTPRGWQAVAAWLERPAEEAATQLFAGVRPPVSSAEPALFARTPDLARIGAPLPNGTGVIMWVRTSDPAPPPPEANQPYEGPVRYWRNAVYVDYTGQGWARATSSSTSANLAADPDARVLKQDFEILAAHGSDLYAVNRPISTTVNGGLLVLSPRDAWLAGEPSRYQVDSAPPDLAGLLLQETAWETAEATPYRDLPDSLPARVRGLAAEITAGAATDLDKALAVQDYLRDTYPYDLAVPPAPSGRDVVDVFLFETGRGFCSHFASAMVVLLRASAVPARVASGYAMGTYDQAEGAWRVTESQAHAWVEVLLPGVGWVEFEPTPSQPARRYTVGAAADLPIPDTANVPVSPNNPRLGISLLGVVGLVALLVVWMIWGARREARPIATRVVDLYWEMCAWLALAGVPIAPGQTPAEHAAATHAQLGRWPG